MKKRVVIGLISLLSLAAYAIQNPGLDRRISIGSSPIMELKQGNFQIVLAPGTAKVTQFAAEELQSFLSRVLGTQVPIARAAGPGGNIFVGFSDATAAKGLVPAALARDGYYIRTVGKDLYIAGRDDAKENIYAVIQTGGYWSFNFERATLFGVYDFLERFAGCRFYFPGEMGTVVPTQGGIALPQIDIVERPNMLRRFYLGWYDGQYFEGSAEERKVKKHPQKNLNMMRVRFGTFNINCNHGLAGGFALLERFGKEHPEYFRMSDTGIRDTNPNQQHAGQLCWSSKFTDEIYQDLKAYFTGQPPETRNIVWDGKVCWPFVTFFKEGYVDVMPQDSFAECHCPDCKKARINSENYATELVWNKVIGWAEQLKKDGIPGFLSMSSYYPYENVPQRPVPDNIEVQVCTTGPWVDNPVVAKQNNDRVAAWARALGRPVHLWNYVLKHGRTNIPGVPSSTPRCVGKYYQAIAPYIFGAFMESESDKFIYHAMNYYMMCRVLWNSNTDVDATLDEYYRKMFGKAAPVMQGIMDDFETIWVSRIAGKTINTPLGPVASVPADNTLWNDIFSAAKLMSIAEEFDKAAGLVDGQSIEGRRVAFFRREFLDSLEASRAAYMAKTNVVQALKFQVPGATLHLIPFTGAGKKPVTGETVQTDVKAKFTDDALIVTFDCEEPRVNEIQAKVRDHDDYAIWRDSSVEIFLDPSGEGKFYYQWMINTKGSITDVKNTVFGKNYTHDLSWESGATAKVDWTKRGFTVEVAIPLRALGPLNPRGVPANFGRNRVLDSSIVYHELYTWSPFATSFHTLEVFGKMIKDDKEMVIGGNFDDIPQRDASHWGYYTDKGYFGWSSSKDFPEGTSVALDNTVFFSAPYSMRMTSGRPNGVSVSQMIEHGKFKPNTTYRISCLVKMENVVATDTNGGFVLNVWDDANRFYPKTRMTGSTDWAYISFIHKTSATVDKSDRSYLEPRLLYATGTAWVDDVSIEEIDE